jgi:hypothetical protein
MSEEAELIERVALALATAELRSPHPSVEGVEFVCDMVPMAHDGHRWLARAAIKAMREFEASRAMPSGW